MADVALIGIGIMATLADAPAVAGAITVVSVAKTGVEMMDGDISIARGVTNIAVDSTSTFVPLPPKVSVAIDVTSYIGNNIADNITTIPEL